ncbi:hypothetical protein GBAR_LOCUS17989 [Geodia barretti]|uniref:Uncharacterized protein n=1 Tax=Geodia barretti TaxID=519541 RepID=A0AA35SKD4_GEOBA|nr:hypothetical protein GBAR_LOCUS17989 [Geodia barretti]
MVIVFFIRKLQRAKASMNTTGVEMPTLSGKKYLGSEQFQTSSNEAYNVVRGTGSTVEGEYEVPRDLPPSTSSQPTTAAAGDSLYEPV